MRENRLRAVWRRKFVHTTDSGHALPVSDNLLARRFNPSCPNQAWVSDITYIRTRSGWLYLAVLLDLYARKVVGWAMAPTLHAELVRAALQLTIAQRQPAPGLIVHSDRGSQYAIALHQGLLVRHGLVGSMSRKGNCWDDAVMERFFLSLKTERVWQRDYANHAEAMTDIADLRRGLLQQRAPALPTGQLATQCLRAAIGNYTTYRGVRKNLTTTVIFQLLDFDLVHPQIVSQLASPGHRAHPAGGGDRRYFISLLGPVINQSQLCDMGNSHQASQTMDAAKWTAPRKLRAVLS
jgi:transposase InsO family protein